MICRLYALEKIDLLFLKAALVGVTEMRKF